MAKKYFNFKKLVVAGILALGSQIPAHAADLGIVPPSGAVLGGCSDIVLNCENGREYPLCPIAVSLAGDIVTATLHTGPNRPAYVRLVPMGVGYRYAGRNIWLDGLRENAILNFGKHNSVACTVTTP
ncbi:MAG: hypothetical protein BGN91_05105 [Nitrobacter sp. 62-13]|jgi:hypothetical protein|uniref:hypothetical protein n=1 Tax=Nitrobacter sp. 62-13 TaxID=1895797 RepID=UPI0009604DF9|nr:hypothetical protein [Nitrobacter sp. 62-13]OJU30318.1 MAG: hypothetical protein BGN91_05105 [Nitrobacter sp. 62-13]